jgi:enoyl-CoA hydratase/carnithine racemase
LGGTGRLPRLIGSVRAKQMIFTGEPITAEVAERWGLVNEVVPAASLSECVRTLAEQVAANAPLAVQTAKPLIASPSAATLESLAGAVNAYSDDAKD